MREGALAVVRVRGAKSGVSAPSESLIPRRGKAQKPGQPKNFADKSLKTNNIQEKRKKYDAGRKKGLRPPAPIRKYPLTGDAVMLQRDARRTGRQRTVRTAGTKNSGNAGGARQRS